MASENGDATAGWRAAMVNLGYVISDQTVGNVLRRNGLLARSTGKAKKRWATLNALQFLE